MFVKSSEMLQENIWINLNLHDPHLLNIRNMDLEYILIKNITVGRVWLKKKRE